LRLHVRCQSAPWENTTIDKNEAEAIDFAYNLAEDYQCDVDLLYDTVMQSSGLTSRVVYTTVSPL
jgi:hypothetical protein